MRGEYNVTFFLLIFVFNLAKSNVYMYIFSGLSIIFLFKRAIHVKENWLWIKSLCFTDIASDLYLSIWRTPWKRPKYVFVEPICLVLKWKLSKRLMKLLKNLSQPKDQPLCYATIQANCTDPTCWPSPPNLVRLHSCIIFIEYMKFTIFTL